MARKQTNIRLDELTRAAIKKIAATYNMSESQVITRAVILLEQELKSSSDKNHNSHFDSQIDQKVDREGREGE